MFGIYMQFENGVNWSCKFHINYPLFRIIRQIFLVIFLLWYTFSFFTVLHCIESHLIVSPSYTLCVPLHIRTLTTSTKASIIFVIIVLLCLCFVFSSITKFICSSKILSLSFLLSFIFIYCILPMQRCHTSSWI